MAYPGSGPQSTWTTPPAGMTQDGNEAAQKADQHREDLGVLKTGFP